MRMREQVQQLHVPGERQVRLDPVVGRAGRNHELPVHDGAAPNIPRSGGMSPKTKDLSGSRRRGARRSACVHLELQGAARLEPPRGAGPKTPIPDHVPAGPGSGSAGTPTPLPELSPSSRGPLLRSLGRGGFRAVRPFEVTPGVGRRPRVELTEALRAFTRRSARADISLDIPWSLCGVLLLRSEADREGRRAGDLPEVPAVPVGGQLSETPGSDEGGDDEDLTSRRPSAPYRGRSGAQPAMDDDGEDGAPSTGSRPAR